MKTYNIYICAKFEQLFLLHPPRIYIGTIFALVNNFKPFACPFQSRMSAGNHIPVIISNIVIFFCPNRNLIHICQTIFFIGMKNRIYILYKHHNLFSFGNMNMNDILVFQILLLMTPAFLPHHIMNPVFEAPFSVQNFQLQIYVLFQMEKITLKRNRIVDIICRRKPELLKRNLRIYR